MRRHSCCENRSYRTSTMQPSVIETTKVIVCFSTPVSSTVVFSESVMD